ncbi:MAG: DUF4962 domain-containing protein [Verrucomicrobia bacterium]|jgi:hypothetical protein|nr:DUF4962 domain-containing protein [Verrucomicrobiota bacterium]MBT7065756.1 DUF4962 domain-containing protein [Verrucomicrobiota bacterium]MBT7701883.1 DUF4962 domain-containing protein [Verrucomicrobiota bacterium]
MMNDPCCSSALPVGPFSGVDLSCLLKKTTLESETVFEADAAEFEQYGSGMKFEEQDGRTVAVTEEGFSLRFKAKMSPGAHAFLLPGHGPDKKRTGTFELLIDGEPVRFPIGLMGKPLMIPSTAFHISESREYEFVLKPTGEPGSVITSMRIERRSVKVNRPPMREDLLGKHPRLYFTDADLDVLRARLDHPRVGLFYELPAPLTEKPPPFQTGEGARNGMAWIQLKDQALAYVLEPTDERLAGILEWLEMATTYGFVGARLDSGYMMEALGLAYDWMYPTMSDELREGVRGTIVRQCEGLLPLSMEGRDGSGGCFQAHRCWFANMALSLGAAAVYEDVPEAAQWLAWGLDRLERIVMSASPDGGWHEGPGYWGFGIPRLFIFTDIYERCSGLQIPAGDDFFRRQTEWRAQHMFPGLKQTAAFGDVGRDAEPPATKLLLWGAKRYQDPVAMGMAEAMNQGPCSDAFNLLWLDENLPAPAPSEAAPLMSRFDDLGMVLARTSWEDDATYFAITSRPLGGQLQARLNVEQKFPGGCFHGHPDQGHFILFGRGQELAGDPGYSIKKETKNHNTILVAILIGAKGSTPPKIDHASGEAHDAVRIGDTLIAFNRGDSEMSIETPWGEKLTTPAKVLVADARGDTRSVVTLPKSTHKESTST